MREINLIGQDTTCYGEDLGLAGRPGRICWRGWPQIETPREKWIRFLYAYPNKVTQRLLDTIAAHRAAGQVHRHAAAARQRARAEAHEARRVAATSS